MRTFKRSESPETFVRTARVEVADTTDGTFEMTLATEGEASDGHILSIKGAKMPERMPLFVSHMNDPTTQAGSIVGTKKFLKDKPPRLRATGQIEMGGEGPSAEIRRDIAYMISKGHVGAVSVRWDEVPGKAVRRINLPSDHAHYVNAQEVGPDDARYWGWFFSEWSGREGSIVGLGADPAALIGRADETSGEVSTFWRAQAADVAAGTPEAKIERAIASLRFDAAAAVELGASIVDVVNAVTHECDRDAEAEMFQAVHVGESVFFLPRTIAEAINARLPLLAVEVDTDSGLVVYVDPAKAADLAARLEKVSVTDPAPILAPVDLAPEIRKVPFKSTSVAAYLASEMRKRDVAMAQETDALIDRVRGKVTK